MNSATAVHARDSVHRLVVLERGRWRGIISATDVVRYVAEHA